MRLAPVLTCLLWWVTTAAAQQCCPAGDPKCNYAVGPGVPCAVTGPSICCNGWCVQGTTCPPVVTCPYCDTAHKWNSCVGCGGTMSAKRRGVVAPVRHLLRCWYCPPDAPGCACLDQPCAFDPDAVSTASHGRLCPPTDPTAAGCMWQFVDATGAARNQYRPLCAEE